MINFRLAVEVDATRALAVLVAGAAIGAVIVGLAAATAETSFSPDAAMTTGFLLVAGLRGYMRHGIAQPQTRLLWALAYGATTAAFLVAFVAATVAVSRTISLDSIVRQYWLAPIGVGLLLAQAAEVLWERSALRRRLALRGFLALCVVLAGLSALQSGDVWTTPGLLIALFGVITFIVVNVERRWDKDHESDVRRPTIEAA